MKPGMEGRLRQSRLGECPLGLRNLIVAERGRWLGLLLSGLVGEDGVGEEGGEMGCMMGLGWMVLKQGCMVGDCSLKLGCRSLARERMLVMQLEVDTMLKDGYPSSKADYMRLE